jgi:hypothetical protein
MIENTPILSLKNVQLSSLEDRKRDKQIPTLNFRGKTFRPLSVFFNITCKDNAQVFCRSFSKLYGNQCVLLQKNNEYGVWIEIDRPQISIPTTEKVETEAAKEKVEQEQLTNTQICLLLLQVITDDIEYLMGNRKKEHFQEEVSQIFQQFLSTDSAVPASIDYLLMLDPLTAKNLPDWTEEQIDELFARVGSLAIRYFGNISFLDRALEAIKELPVYQNSEVLRLCMKFVLICKNIEKQK